MAKIQSQRGNHKKSTPDASLRVQDRDTRPIAWCHPEQLAFRFLGPACSHPGVRLTWVLMRDGRRWHLREDCATCGRFLKFRRQDEEGLAVAPGQPAVSRPVGCW